MEVRRSIYRAGTGVLLVAGLTSFGLVAHTDAAAGRAAPAASAKKVTIKESANRYHYTPTKTTVTKGTKVTWANMTDVEHNVTVTQGLKINKDIAVGKSVNFTFTKAGTYKYHCEYHPYMKGTVVVK